MNEKASEHCCICSISEDRVNRLGIAAQILQDSEAGRELKEQAEALLLAAFKREMVNYEGLPKL